MLMQCACKKARGGMQPRPYLVVLSDVKRQSVSQFCDAAAASAYCRLVPQINRLTSSTRQAAVCWQTSSDTGAMHIATGTHMLCNAARLGQLLLQLTHDTCYSLILLGCQNKVRFCSNLQLWFRGGTGIRCAQAPSRILLTCRYLAGMCRRHLQGTGMTLGYYHSQQRSH